MATNADNVLPPDGTYPSPAASWVIHHGGEYGEGPGEWGWTVYPGGSGGTGPGPGGGDNNFYMPTFPVQWGWGGEFLLEWFQVNFQDEIFMNQFMGGFPADQISVPPQIPEMYDYLMNYVYSSQYGYNIYGEYIDYNASVAQSYAYTLESWYEGLNSAIHNWTPDQNAPAYYGEWLNFPEWGEGNFGAAMDANELVDLWNAEEWQTIFGPMIGGVGVDVEDWMEEWSEYIQPWDPTGIHQITDLRDSQTQEARIELMSVLEDQKNKIGQSGFTETYAGTQLMNDTINEFSGILDSIDTQAQASMQSEYEMWAADFWTGIQMTTELGAFDVCHYHPEWHFCDG